MGQVGSYSSSFATGRGGLDVISASSETCTSTSEWFSRSQPKSKPGSSVDGLVKQNSGTGWSRCTAVTVVLLGLGKDGMLKLDDWPDCRYADRAPAVPGDADLEDMASAGCEVKPGSWKVVQLLKLGELEVNEARRVDIRRCGAKAVRLDGRERWVLLDTKGRPPIVLPVPSKSSGSSSMPCIMLGLVGLLGGGPRICGVRVEIRTQFCLLCPLRALGLPLRADGFCKGTLSH